MHCSGNDVCWIGRQTENGSAQTSFPTKHRAEHTCEPYGHNNCEIYTAIARVLERIEVWAGRGATFGVRFTAPFVAFLPAVKSGAPTVLC